MKHQRLLWLRLFSFILSFFSYYFIWYFCRRDRKIKCLCQQPFPRPDIRPYQWPAGYSARCSLQPFVQPPPTPPHPPEHLTPPLSSSVLISSPPPNGWDQLLYLSIALSLLQPIHPTDSTCPLVIKTLPKPFPALNGPEFVHRFKVKLSQFEQSSYLFSSLESFFSSAPAVKASEITVTHFLCGNKKPKV